MSEYMNTNDLIRKLQSISEEKRKLPIIIRCPNGLEVEPKIKLKFKDFTHPILGGELESIMIAY